MGIFFILLTALMLAVFYLDATRYLIPNWLVGTVIAAYPCMVMITPVSVNWLEALEVMAGVFAVGYVVFILRLMGGGDVKLLTACALWVGLPGLMDYLLYVAALGGALGLALYIGRKLLAAAAPAVALSPRLPRILREREPLPYGLAIAAAFLWLLWHGLLPGLAVA